MNCYQARPRGGGQWGHCPPHNFGTLKIYPPFSFKRGYFTLTKNAFIYVRNVSQCNKNVHILACPPPLLKLKVFAFRKEEILKEITL